MKIKIINPNTTQSMTTKIDQCAQAVAGKETRIITVNPRMGPVSIESHYDEALSVPGLLDEIRRGEQEGIDGYVIACFGDPGLYAAREIADGPVLGIAEAAMHMASLVGTGFSVVTTLARTCNIAWHLAERYGMKRFCRHVHASDLAVLELERTGSEARRIITDLCRRALEEDGSDCIVLGCAGMADLCDEISNAIGAPVIDGVACAVKLTEAMISIRLNTSKRGDWARPLPKPYTGMLAPYALR